MNEQIAKMMKALDITETEAKELLETDKRIDRGEELFELSKEQKKVAKKMKQADKKKSDTPVKRERKPNETKRELIQMLAETLRESSESLEITNIERQIDFLVAGTKYRIVLSAPRS